MHNQLKIFEKAEFGSVRVVMKEDEPWFVAKDVCNALGYVWKGVATIGHIPEEWRGVYSVQTPSGGGALREEPQGRFEGHPCNH